MVTPSQMPDDYDSDEMTEFIYRVQRERLSPAPHFPDRALTPHETQQYLEELGYDLDTVTVWVPNENGLEHEGLLKHRETARGDILRFYIEHATRMELYTLLPMEEDGVFQWHHNDNPNEGLFQQVMAQSKAQIGWRELTAILEDGESPDIPMQYVRAASFFHGSVNYDDYTPYLPAGWTVTQAARVSEASEPLHPVYKVTVVHEPSSTVVIFNPAGTEQYDEYSWTIDTVDDVTFPTSQYQDAYGEMLRSDETTAFLTAVTDELPS